jgi:hypothetical protein
VPIVGPINPHNAKYLQTKRDKLGHALPVDLLDRQHLGGGT